MGRSRIAALLCTGALLATGLATGAAPGVQAAGPAPAAMRPGTHEPRTHEPGAAAAATRAGAPAPAVPAPCVNSPLPYGWQAADVVRIAEQARKQLDLAAVLLRVTVDGKELVTTGLGESMAGVPAVPAQHFRAGAVADAVMGTALLRLVDEGRVRLDDPVSRWLPDLPYAHRITLRMLAASTSGLVDYSTDPAFLAAQEDNPFRQWTSEELVARATGKPLLYAPGANWSRSRANSVILGSALERITGTRLDVLLRQRVLDPLGMHETRAAATPEIPSPVLHAFTTQDGSYEDSTYWNPSWTTAPGAVLTTDICDLARSAAGVGSGALLSSRSRAALLDPGTVGLGGPTSTCPASVCLKNTEATHYGTGVLVVDDWVVQNPSFSGYSAVQAYLPADRLAIAVATTEGRRTPGGNTAELVMTRLAEVLAPGRAPHLG
ncbi:serine hydrolase domain-containing protein [Streptomyces sp. JL2001]|uniref:serine hydrolase domain-containing protein n=1 Tax=Streptomyces sp. JL2001 TaxID=3342488 RepID=UPI003D800F7F